MSGKMPSAMRVSGRLAIVVVSGLSVAACSSSRISEPSYLTPPERMVRSASPPVQPRAQVNYQRPRPAPAASRPRQSFGRSIGVARGDTLYHLSRRHGVSVNALMTENRLSSTRLSVGQTLYLPYAR